MRNESLETAHQPGMDKERIKIPILVPLFVSILLLLVTFTLAIYNLQQRHINNDVRMRLDNTRRSFSQLLATDARLLDATTRFLKNDPNIQNAWLARDRDRLLGYTTPLLESFHRDYKVTHIYFIDSNDTCFLRVHNPSRFGDRIDRFTLKSAAKTRELSWGIELGPYGTFALRVVQPWFVNNTLTGYIELGEEIEHIIPQLKEALDVDVAILINKSFLTRQGWEEGLKVIGRSGDWDMMPNCVIADSTIGSIPSEFIKLACLTHKAHGEHIISAALNGSIYRGGFVKLQDAAGREVGDILVIKNVSDDQASLYTLLAVVAALCFFVAALLVSFFYVHITHIEKRLINAHASLITEIEKREEAEAELRRHRDNLEETVRSRTAELKEANKRLQQEVAQRTKAEKSLERANADLESTITQLLQSNRQLREFDHLVAHDLKTPLRGIGTLAQWLFEDYRDKLDDNARRQIDLLVKRVRRMDNLIDAILQYATTVRNKNSEHNVDLDKLLGEVIGNIKHPSNIEIAVKNKLPALICDESYMRQVFQNLLVNAVKFMDKPQGRITIECTEEDLFWRFSVSDNGPGIERKHFVRVFNLFQKLGDPEDTESAGIGLTLVRKIVELYGGQVWLTSKVGEGSTFFFTLPKQPAVVATQTPQPAAT